MRSAAHPLCCTPRCRNKKAKLGKKADGSVQLASYCHSCRSAKWRESHPIQAAYYNLKHRAKERGHSFTITRSEFEKWCEETRYHELKAKHKDGMSIDRKREHEGYHIGNIQMMTLGDNSRKMHAMKKFASTVPGVDPSKPYTEEEKPW